MSPLLAASIACVGGAADKITQSVVVVIRTTVTEIIVSIDRTSFEQPRKFTIEAFEAGMQEKDVSILESGG